MIEEIALLLIGTKILTSKVELKDNYHHLKVKTQMHLKKIRIRKEGETLSEINKSIYLHLSKKF